MSSSFVIAVVVVTFVVVTFVVVVVDDGQRSNK